MTDNILPDSGIVQTPSHLAGALQDMWHYAALIKPPADGRRSTFDGSRPYVGLIGKLRAYEALRNTISAWQIECLPAFCDVQLLDVDQVNTVVELEEQTGYAIHAINAVAVANHIDAYSGTVKVEVVS